MNLIIHHENYVLSGDTVYLNKIISNINDSDCILIYFGNKSVIEYIKNNIFNKNIKLHLFNPYTYTSLTHYIYSYPIYLKLLIKVFLKILNPLLNALLTYRVKILLKNINEKSYGKLIVNSGGILGTETSRALLRICSINKTYILHNHVTDNLINNPNNLVNIISNIDSWIVGSSQIYKQLTSNLMINEGIVELIYYGQNPSTPIKSISKNLIRKKLGIDLEAFVVLHPSVFAKYKGHSFTVNAFYDYLKINKNANLILAGDGGDNYHNIKIMINKLNLDTSTIFTGYYEPLEELIICADVLCIPSQGNATNSFVILLALACGTAIITTENNDYGDLLQDNINTVLVPRGSHYEIKNAFNSLHSNSEMRSKITSNGKKTYLEYFTEESMIIKTINNIYT
jgi:glycosyltransferase involved in cell wall biosynthesis